MEISDKNSITNSRHMINHENTIKRNTMKNHKHYENTVTKTP